jgi:antitoxin (DNA-binding transcriptional repressor) of toxin-antitoxin stability system
MQTISATDLARNTREIMDRVSSHGETVAIQRNQILIAQIVPARRTMSAAQAIEGLSQTMLTPKQANTWLTESKEQFSDEVRDPWA